MASKSRSPWLIEDSGIPAEEIRSARLEYLVRYAVLAPSTHNTQPWLFRVRRDALELIADRSREAIGAVSGLRNAVYFSTITYGAIGYDDAAMAKEWRLVSAIEGINGIILVGWSTAFFVTVSARLRRL